MSSGANHTMYRSALFRTCLWPCASRWASGQEAGQPPGTSDPIRSSFRTLDWQPEAKPAHPVLKRGTRLKATTERAFLVSAGFPQAGPGYRRGLSFIAGRAEGVFPSNPRQHGRLTAVTVAASPQRVGVDSCLRIMPGARRAPCDFLGECHDRAHSRIPA